MDVYDDECDTIYVVYLIINNLLLLLLRRQTVSVKSYKWLLFKSATVVTHPQFYFFRHPNYNTAVCRIYH